MTPRLRAQLACVAFCDADGLFPDPYEWPPRDHPPPTPETMREYRRLQAIGQTLLYEARRGGHTDTSGDGIWGEVESLDPGFQTERGIVSAHETEVRQEGREAGDREPRGVSGLEGPADPPGG